MRKSKFATFVGVGVAAASFALVQAPGASAAGTTPVEAEESVKLRTHTKLSSTAVGLFPKKALGKAANDAGSDNMRVYKGGTHNHCGSKGTINDRKWVKVSYKGKKGYVALNCIDVVADLPGGDPRR
ncbi:hypothetical protein [Streptomyces sp. BA2]|uniref:hypothetical protein n=1 Tax=Streptomyces sp. BA2 TaxID=436595 RepID=UPI001327E6FF|nr:hypothetical protein [Streptomyces sp. BA2]MWA16163.1 hypothetical protein [Streptomyces sp. BA2]